MIIKCKVRAGPTQLAAYLLNEKKNERAELLEMRGFRRNLASALSLEEEVAKRETHCEKPFYHAAFRAAPGESLTPEQWQHCADKFERAVGLEGHNRALVLHTHDGEKHLHVVWSRLDPETLRVAQLSFEHYRAKETARELERELGLQQVRDKAPERDLAAPTFNEDQQARRKGQNLNETRAAIREAWEQSDNGKSFAAALKERGFELAQGERRDFVALDEDGSVYSIGKRTTGARAAEVRERLADLDREDMPTVDQVREQQRAERGREQEQEREDREPEREQAPDRNQAPEREPTQEREREQERAAPKMGRTERFLKRQDEYKAELLQRQEAERNRQEKWMERRDEKLEAWFKAKAHKLEEQAVISQLTKPAERVSARRREMEEQWERERVERQKESLARSLGKIKAIRREENARRVEEREARHADQRDRLEIRQAEIRQRYGIKAPDRDEAARAAAAELKERAFTRAEREADRLTMKAKTEQINRAAELERQARARERKEQREREHEARKQAWQEETESRKQEYEGLQERHEARRAAKMGAKLYRRADMVSVQRDAIKDVRARNRTRQRLEDNKSIAERDAEDRAAKLAEQTERLRQQREREDRQRQEQERPRHKSIAELDAEHKDAIRAKLERLRSMPKGDRQQEQTDRQQERSEERAQARERGSGDRDRER